MGYKTDPCNKGSTHPDFIDGSHNELLKSDKGVKEFELFYTNIITQSVKNRKLGWQSK